MMTARRKYPIGIQTFSEIIHGGYVYAKLYEQYLVLLHSFYSTLKSCDAYIRFAFLTGITRFGKLSVFSGLNNLKDISMAEEFAAICGFTDDEVRRMSSQHFIRVGI